MLYNENYTYGMQHTHTRKLILFVILKCSMLLLWLPGLIRLNEAVLPY